MGPMLLILLIIPFVIDPGLSDRYFAIRMVLVILGLLLSFLWLRQKTFTISVNLLDICIAGFIFWSWLSLLWAINLSEALINNLRYSTGGLIYLYWRYATQQPKPPLDKIITLFHVVGLIYIVVSWIGMLKYGLEYSFSNKDLYRLQYPAGHKSIIAEYIVFVLPFALLDSSLKRFKYVTFLLGIGAIMVLQSRAAFLGLMALLLTGMVLMIAKEKRSLWKYLVGLMLLIVIGLWAIRDHPLGQRMHISGYLESQTAQERILVWQKTWRLIKEHPVVGVGSGNWKIYFPSTGLEAQWIFENRDVIFTRAHNDFLEIAAEGGAVGFLIWILILLISWSAAIKNRDNPIGLISVMFLAAYSTVSMFDFPKERVEMLFLFWMLLGLNVHHVKTFRKLHISRNWVLGFLSLLLVFMIPKYLGERDLVKVLNARAQNDWNSVIKYSNRSATDLYSTDPYAMPIMWYKGLAQYQLGKFDEAHHSFKLAYHQHPWQYHVLNNLATTYFSRGDAESALDFYVRCENINPHFDDVYFNQAVVFTQLNRFEEAREVLSKFDPTDVKVAQYLSEIKKQEKGFLENE